MGEQEMVHYLINRHGGSKSILGGLEELAQLSVWPSLVLSPYLHSPSHVVAIAGTACRKNTFKAEEDPCSCLCAFLRIM